MKPEKVYLAEVALHVFLLIGTEVLGLPAAVRRFVATTGQA